MKATPLYPQSVFPVPLQQRYRLQTEEEWYTTSPYLSVIANARQRGGQPRKPGGAGTKGLVACG